MSEKPNFKPCPFCGLTDKDTISPEMGQTPAVSLCSYPGGFRVECEGCGCNGPWHHTSGPAIEAWNNSSTARANAWKAMAERLYKAALCDCCEHGGSACHRCLSTVQAYTNLKADEAKSRPG